MIDVAGGFVLALLCYYLVPERSESHAITTNSRIGIYYAIGATLFVIAQNYLQDIMKLASEVTSFFVLDLEQSAR